MQFNKLILILASFLFANVCYGSEILLQCQVSGKYDEEKLAPATLLVTINQFPKYLSIDIDGPSDYLTSVNSISKESNGKILKGRNDSLENTFAIYQSVVDTKNNVSAEFNVSINRITGLITVSNYFRARSGNLHLTEYSGNCSKVSAKQKF
jgi:hypothetical protein